VPPLAAPAEIPSTSSTRASGRHAESTHRTPLLNGQTLTDAALAACVVLSTTRVDVNGAVRRQLGARKASFASMDLATGETGMEYGGITPIGLPADWPILVDESVATHERLIVGSGIRGSKLLVSGGLLASLPNAEVLPIAQRSE